MKNKYCDRSDLLNEAAVERLFVDRLLADLGYGDADVKPKVSLKKLSVKSSTARRAELYRPDYALKVSRKIRWIIEAKEPGTNLDSVAWQPREYCVLLNGHSATDKPVKFYLLTSGELTRLYSWDLNDPLIEIRFNDVRDGAPEFERLKTILARSNILSATKDKSVTGTMQKLRKPTIKEVNTAFARCHQNIYKSDNISQGAAFTEFVKLIALKLLSDKTVRDKHPDKVNKAAFEVPVGEVRFSTAWVDAQSQHTPNPMDGIWFRDFLANMEREIGMGTRKRIFAKNDQIRLSPETIRDVVKELEELFLFGIDADLNGRLFETFLNATMRGKDLGQYFTPRSIVKLGVQLADIKVNHKSGRGAEIHTDRIFDACCGTGGFLIDALADMWGKVDGNSSLTTEQKTSLRQEIADSHIYGIDVGRDPNLCRIARLNMYLHGDGGSSIFNVDALDKKLPDSSTDDAETIQEKQRLREIYASDGGFFDVVLTNPPFAKKYANKPHDAKEEERQATRILKQYDLRDAENGKARSALKSSLMFFERYWDVLKDGGTLVSVIDDGLLSGANCSWFREFLRERFTIRAVVSLPGDAFQRSMARVKTSLIVLTKKTKATEPQADVFMYACKYVGNDDPSRERSLPRDEVIRQHAKKEIEKVSALYLDYLNGKGSSQYLVPAARLSDRLDVKSCLHSPGAAKKNWKRLPVKILAVQDVLELKNFPDSDLINCKTHSGPVTQLRVRYDGIAQRGEEIEPSESTYDKMWVVRAQDIVISNIAASFGSIAFVPNEADGCVVTNEYTVLQPKDGFDVHALWGILRSAWIRADMLLVATGANRTRVRWDTLQKLELPYPSDPKEVKAFSDHMKESFEEERKLFQDRIKTVKSFEKKFGLQGTAAQDILTAFKPPD